MGPVVAGALKAAPYVLGALGGLFGKKKKYIDPEELKRRYGPQAIAGDTTALAQFILNSPYGQQLLANAAEQGQSFQNEMNSRAAASGLGPASGAQSGTSDFATSAAGQAQGSLERGVRSGIFEAAMPIAAQQNARFAELALANQNARNAEPSMFQKIAAASGQLASMPGYPGGNVKKPGEE